ncbi:MAG: GIY-YIG nuclease family protein [Chitinophagaceae bacterium]|nr:GIY-YIG nuclease family protein [Chitinophagaceae bacterium]
MAYFVYVIYSEQYDRFYIGQTQSVEDRLQRHNHGYEHATAPYVPWGLKCSIKKETRAEAMKLERKLKNLNREKLLAFISKYASFL